MKGLVTNVNAVFDSCGDRDNETNAVDDLLFTADRVRAPEREADALTDIDVLSRVVVDADRETSTVALTREERLSTLLTVAHPVFDFESAGDDDDDRLDRSVATDDGDSAFEDAADTLEPMLIAEEVLALADALTTFDSRALKDAERDTNALLVSDASAVEAGEALAESVVRALTVDTPLARAVADTVGDSPALRDVDSDALADAHALDDTRAVPLNVGSRVVRELALGELDAATLPVGVLLARTDEDADGDVELDAEGVLDEDRDGVGDNLDETVAEVEASVDADGYDAVALVVEEVDGVVFGEIVAWALCELDAVVVAEVEIHAELTADTDMRAVPVALPLTRRDAVKANEVVVSAVLVVERVTDADFDGRTDDCAVTEAVEVIVITPEYDSMGVTDSVSVGASVRRPEKVSCEVALTGSLASAETVTSAETLRDDVAAFVCVAGDDGDTDDESFPDAEYTPVVFADTDANSVGRGDSLEQGEADAVCDEISDALESADVEDEAVDWKLDVESPLFEGVRDSAVALMTGVDDGVTVMGVVADEDAVETIETDIFGETDEESVDFKEAVAAVLGEVERVNGDADCDLVSTVDALL